MKIPFNVLDRQYEKYRMEYETKALAVLRSGWYVLGKEVEAFEAEFATYIGTKQAVGVANGLDALVLAFRALEIGVGDEVIVAANAYIACFMGISMNGATPVPVEPDEYHNLDPAKIKEKITDKTKAVLAVHLYGQTCQMDAIGQICREEGLYLVEDCAQSHGSTWQGQKSGSFGDISCFSFYPSKNLGCFGDGGAALTDDENLARRLRILRNYGSEKRYYNQEVGYNSRLDEMQAGLLRVKLAHLAEITDERVALAKRYLKGICQPALSLPKIAAGATSVWHLFPVLVSDRPTFMDYLESKGIATVIHYPIPPHLSQAYRYLGYRPGDFPKSEELASQILSLPLYNGMTKEEQDYVIEMVNQY